jgi:hypothetical protein
MIHLQRVFLVSVAACVWLLGAERKPFSLGAPERIAELPADPGRVISVGYLEDGSRWAITAEDVTQRIPRLYLSRPGGTQAVPVSLAETVGALGAECQFMPWLSVDLQMGTGTLVRTDPRERGRPGHIRNAESTCGGAVRRRGHGRHVVCSRHRGCILPWKGAGVSSDPPVHAQRGTDPVVFPLSGRGSRGLRANVAQKRELRIVEAGGGLRESMAATRSRSAFVAADGRASHVLA